MSDPFGPLDNLRLPIVPVEPRASFVAALLRRIEHQEEPAAQRSATVRYFVDDLDAAVDFYRDLLGFEVELRPSLAFAMLYRGDLRLLLSVPGSGGSGGAALSDGTLPEPGGWNRFALKVPDLDATVKELHGKGAGFRNDIVTGVGVKEILLQDPAGTLVELFQPLAAYHERPQQQTTS
jgi:catechol 2,3-dioxygenase-like lactoylglutathione lyase family enzyme